MSLYAALILYPSLIPLGLILYYYLTRSAWWKYPFGRVIVGLLLSLTAMLIIGTIAYVSDFEWINIVRAIVYGAMHLMIWYMLWILRKAQVTNEDGTREKLDIQRAWDALTRRRKK